MRSSRRGTQPDKDSAQPTSPPRGSSDDVRKRMDDIYAEIQHSWRNGQFHLPLKFVDFHKTDVMFFFVRAAIGYSLAFVKVKTLEKELLQMLQDKKRCNESKERNEDDQQLQHACGVVEHKDRIKQAIEVQKSCTHNMSSCYARLILHCSNFENHKEDERFFECVYFFVCSVVKLGVVPDYWRTLEEELGYFFRGEQFSANIKLHAATAYQDGQSANSAAEPQDSSSASYAGIRPLSCGNGGGNNNINNNGVPGSPGGTGGRKILSPTAGTTKDSPDRLKAIADPSAFELPKSRVSHFAPSVPARRIVAELQATKDRASRNMEISQALRDRIRNQRNDDRRRHLEAVMSSRHTLDLDTLDAEISSGPHVSAVATLSRPHNVLSSRISMKSTYTTRSPALNRLLPTTEDRVRLALRGYEQELQAHKVSRTGDKKNSYDGDVPTSLVRELRRK